MRPTGVRYQRGPPWFALFVILRMSLPFFARHVQIEPAGTRATSEVSNGIVMASMQTRLTSLARRAFATGRPSVTANTVTTTSCSFSSVRTAASPVAAAVAPPPSAALGTIRLWSSRRSLDHKQQRQQERQQQRRGLSTLKRGLNGPLSAKLRLPMRGLEEFRDPEVVKAGDVPIVGRNWTVQELRRKSFEDLHKLWFVLYKEKNMLNTEVLLSRRTKVPIPAGDRRQKVKRSMKAIKVVVGERQRVKRAALRDRQLAAKREERAAAAESEEEAALAEEERGNAKTLNEPTSSS